jgi:hypothetical protein
MRNFKERNRGFYSEQLILFLIPSLRFGLDCLVLFLIFWIVRNNPKGRANSGFLYELSLNNLNPIPIIPLNFSIFVQHIPTSFPDID